MTWDPTAEKKVEKKKFKRKMQPRLSAMQDVLATKQGCAVIGEIIAESGVLASITSLDPNITQRHLGAREKGIALLQWAQQASPGFYLEIMKSQLNKLTSEDDQETDNE